MVDSQPKGVLY